VHPLELWQAVILGLVEGITEYLPISSTGHLILAGDLMGLTSPRQREAMNAFNIVIQGGAIIAVLGLYWPSVLRMLKGLVGKDPGGLRLVVNLFIAFLPAAIVGLLLEDWIDRYLFHTGPVLLALAVGGIYMMGIDLWRQGRLLRPRRWREREMEIYDVTARQALTIGLLQCIAMWPGTSRSMMTITGGLIAGLPPRQAAQFSFLLGLPTLGAATLYKLAKNLKAAQDSGGPNLFDELGLTACLVGMAVAAISAAIAVKWLVGFLNRHGLSPFGWYRLALCVVLIGFISTGLVSISDPEAGRVERSTGTVPPVNFVEPPAGEH
jgi:undecaprenyl-diphosphatase